MLHSVRHPGRCWTGVLRKDTFSLSLTIRETMNALKLILVFALCASYVVSIRFISYFIWVFLSEIDTEFHQKLFCIYWCIHRVFLFFVFYFILFCALWNELLLLTCKRQTSFALLWPSPLCHDLLFFLCIDRFDLLHFRLFWAQIYSRVWY